MITIHTSEDYVHHLHASFQHIEMNGLRVNVQRCLLGASELDFCVTTFPDAVCHCHLTFRPSQAFVNPRKVPQVSGTRELFKSL